MITINWEYGKSSSKVKTYNINSTQKSSFGNNSIKENNTSYNFRTPESFLAGINKKSDANIDLTKYKAGIKVFHKKFGDGIINYVEPEGEDLKVDITFDKAGHKRLMAKFAKLEIIE